MLSAKSSDLKASAAEIEGHDIGVGLVSRVRPHARASEPGLDLA